MKLRSARSIERHSDSVPKPRAAEQRRLAATAQDGELDVGAAVRSLRRERGLGLAEASLKLGIGRSTLAKIEAGQMSPTVGLLQKIARGLEVDITALISTRAGEPANGRRTITRAGTGRVHKSYGNVHEALAGELSNKRMLPFRSRIIARTTQAIPDWHRHDGEEFVYVLEGRVTMYSEFYEPSELGVGDSVYLDGRMGHCIIAAGDEDAVVLFVMTS